MEPFFSYHKTKQKHGACKIPLKLQALLLLCWRIHQTKVKLNLKPRAKDYIWNQLGIHDKERSMFQNDSAQSTSSQVLILGRVCGRGFLSSSLESPVRMLWSPREPPAEVFFFSVYSAICHSATLTPSTFPLCWGQRLSQSRTKLAGSQEGAPLSVSAPATSAQPPVSAPMFPVQTSEIKWWSGRRWKLWEAFYDMTCLSPNGMERTAFRCWSLSLLFGVYGFEDTE